MNNKTLGIILIVFGGLVLPGFTGCFTAVRKMAAVLPCVCTTHFRLSIGWRSVSAEIAESTPAMKMREAGERVGERVPLVEAEVEEVDGAASVVVNLDVGDAADASGTLSILEDYRLPP